MSPLRIFQRHQMREKHETLDYILQLQMNKKATPARGVDSGDDLSWMKWTYFSK